MEPIKKIVVKKRTIASKPLHDSKTQEKQDALAILEHTVKKLSNRFNQYGFNDSKEEEFLKENKGKLLLIDVQDRCVEGTLEAIDKYRICINIDDKLHYFYKHAVIGYYLKK